MQPPNLRNKAPTYLKAESKSGGGKEGDVALILMVLNSRATIDFSDEVNTSGQQYSSKV